MIHEIPLITTLAAALGLALVLGLAAVRLRLPALVGYLTAGVLIGPFTPGFVADAGLAGELAEIGVMLLMFGVGLHFSPADLLAVRGVAIPGALLQITVATLLGGGAALWWGWGWGGALVFGLALSVASTVVLLRALEARGILDTSGGRVAVGWLVVEDLAMVLVLVLLPALAGWLKGGGAVGPDVWPAIGLTLLKVAAFVVLMLVVGRRALPRLMLLVARAGNRELFTLCVVAAAVGIAFGASKLFDVSFALGAFFAGMVIRESEFAHRAAEESLPLREAFSVLFFVSVGMLFDPMVLVESPVHVLATLGIIVVGKTAAAALLVRMLRRPIGMALTVSASLAQIGEFSFILAGLGIHLGLLPDEGRNLILAGALISIAINPAVFHVAELLRSRLVGDEARERALERANDPLAELPSETDLKLLSGQVVLVGYGRVGRRIGVALEGANIPHVVVDRERRLVEELRGRDRPAVAGDAADPAVLIQAHVREAAMLVIAVPDPIDARRMAETARRINPEVEIIARAADGDEAELLGEEPALKLFLSEEEVARGMSRHALERFGATA